MQHSVYRFSDAFSLRLSTQKTEVIHQPAPGKPYVEPNITVNNQRLDAVDKFTYPGSTLSSNLVSDDKMNARLAKASVSFGRLHKNVWNRGGIITETTIKVYLAVILTTLLYGCEAWTVYQRHARKLNNFHTTSLRNLLDIKWQVKKSDTEVLTRTGLLNVYTMLM